jgi:GNAT superfamily N-acetyltransferase
MACGAKLAGHGAREPIMQPGEFADYHRPALEADEVRHNVILAILGRVSADPSTNVRYWTLGAPGQCAAQTPPYGIVLADLRQTQCRALAEETRDLDYPGVVGPDRTATWFADRAAELGVTFADPVPQQIHVLRDKPRYPGAAGHARLVGSDDADLFVGWTVAFMREAVPHDPPPDREKVAKAAGEGRYMFWIVDGEPVSMAGIQRRSRNAATIAGVYTPPHLRGRGYAGSVTAAVAERAFAEGKTTACLYTDLRNPFSNRCYAKIGFEPVCASWHYPRAVPEQ